MKKNFLAIAIAVMAMTTQSCLHGYEDYETTAVVEVVIPDSIELVQMQGTITLRNLSNGYKYSSSAFNLSSVQMDLMRGAYSLEAEGTLRFVNKKDKEKNKEVKYFRSSSDYVEITDHPTTIKAKLIFM